MELLQEEEMNESLSNKLGRNNIFSVHVPFCGWQLTGTKDCSSLSRVTNHPNLLGIEVFLWTRELPVLKLAVSHKLGLMATDIIFLLLAEHCSIVFISGSHFFQKCLCITNCVAHVEEEERCMDCDVLWWFPK